ncbi:MAG: DNA double-strand break repair nuclease NurA [Candidatus Helarchaeota archaeon]
MAELNSKSSKILLDFESRDMINLFNEIFKKYWISYSLRNVKINDNIIAVDGSYGDAPISTGGIFYVTRALALSKDKNYKRVFLDFDYSPEFNLTSFFGRVMEWTEHQVIIDVIKDGYSGYILLDGSIYGRFMHIPIELNLMNANTFMIQYFETLNELMTLCKTKNIPLIGISKESKTVFFKEFLIKEMLKSLIQNDSLCNELLTAALKDKRRAIKMAENLQIPTVVELVNELITRKPDSLLIMNEAESTGYTAPLLLGASLRWRNRIKEIERDPELYIKQNFPTTSKDKDFLDKASDVVKKMLELPSIVSFHLLPDLIDTPMRIDIPAWYLGRDDKIREIGWPKIIEDIDITDILDVISAGYCGIDNYNVWLVAVDSQVKLPKKVFEDLYLSKLEEIIGKKITPRGYRRARFP